MLTLTKAVEYTIKVRDNQYPAGKVNTIDFKYLPREKQLYCVSQHTSSDRSRLYRTTIVFEGLTNKNFQDKDHQIPYSGKDGSGIELFIQRPTVNSRIRTRCQCQDYYFMWAAWSKREKALIGPYKPYVRVSPPSGRPEVNPDQFSGLCKHLLSLIKKLQSDRLIPKDNFVWSYVNQPIRQ